MRPKTNWCHKLLAINLKFLNFIQFFIGLSAVIYSSFLLHQWRQSHLTPPAPPSPTTSTTLDHFALLPSGSHLSSLHLPAPWFIYFILMGGIVLCSMSCIGHLAAEAINGCCLCFYFVLTFVLIVLEAALVGFIAIDHHWEKDLPYDPTGQLENFKSFVEENADICKWVGIVLLAVQALSVLLSLVLRALISTQRDASDIENDYSAVRGQVREPLLNSQQNQSSGLTKGEGRGVLSDAWTTRMRQKYGLKNESTKQQPSNNASANAKP